MFLIFYKLTKSLNVYFSSNNHISIHLLSMWLWFNYKRGIIQMPLVFIHSRNKVTIFVLVIFSIQFFLIFFCLNNPGAKMHTPPFHPDEIIPCELPVSNLKRYVIVIINIYTSSQYKTTCWKTKENSGGNMCSLHFSSTT